jgi:hypothetical protein
MYELWTLKQKCAFRLIGKLSLLKSQVINSLLELGVDSEELL